MPRRCLSLILLPLMLAACGGGAPQREAAPGSRWAGMNNPASQYCAELGGRLEIRAEQAGEAGYSLTRHIEILIALLSELRLLPRSEQAA